MGHEEMASRFTVEPQMCDGTDVHAAIKCLDPTDREVVLLVLAGHRSRDIAPMMGVSESRIAQRMRRVRHQLKWSR
jgi:DNA-directed RNA polymerase specialized sigma24 family protein